MMLRLFVGKQVAAKPYRGLDYEAPFFAFMDF